MFLMVVFRVVGLVSVWLFCEFVDMLLLYFLSFVCRRCVCCLGVMYLVGLVVGECGILL